MGKRDHPGIEDERALRRWRDELRTVLH